MPSNTDSSAHREEVAQALSPMGKRLFRFIEFDDSEELLGEIRKHPVGLIFIVITGILISLAIAVALVALALNLDSVGLDAEQGILHDGLIGLGLVLGAFGLVATLIAAILYVSNVVFITNQKIAEVVYLSLFNRRIVQLGMGNVEDVTVNQRGILSRLFNYGGLVVETAGERENPAFTYVPNPNQNSQLIIRAHEEYVERYGN